MHDSIFRTNWYANEMFIRFAQLPLEEIAALLQIINLILRKNGPIKNDPKFIGKSCGLSRVRCEKAINALYDKGEIFFDGNLNIFEENCEKELAMIQEKRKENVENGKKGAKIKWQNHENQDDRDGQAIGSAMASTSTNQRRSKRKHPLPPHENPSVSSVVCSAGFRISSSLTEDGIAAAKEVAPGWDIYALMDRYDDWTAKQTEFPRDPDRAFRGWVLKITKGKPPS